MTLISLIKLTSAKVFLTLLFVVSVFVGKAAYVENIPTRVTNPDGSVLECYVTGDEFFNYLHDKNGFTIIMGEDGYYYYAIKENERLKASNHRALDGPAKSLAIQPGLGISEEEYRQRKNLMSETFGLKSEKAALVGTLNNIVIYIRLSGDSEFRTSQQVFDSILNHESGPSVKHYFQEVSYGNVSVLSHQYPLSQNNQILSYQDPYPRIYFQPYHATTNPYGYKNDTERTNREHQLLHRAVNYTSGEIPPDLNIDADGDGLVDNVCFIIKGENGAWSSLLWAHRWMLHSTQTFIHGKRVWDYTFQPESQATVQILNHEMFHTFGAPDLYRYSGNGITPVGPWDIMHSGAGHMGAYMKWKYSKRQWIETIPEISEPNTYTLNPITSPENNAFKIKSPNSDSEFFIVEYRKKIPGTYEGSLPGSGLLVYRINTQAGNGNQNGPPDEVYIFRPDGSSTQNGFLAHAHFSEQTGRTEIYDETNPASILSNENPGGLYISNITEAGNTISFDLFGGKQTVEYSIALLANPEPAGITFGAGTYTLEEIVTVNAMASEGWEFSYWTVDREIVSSDSSYTFLADQDMELTAHFKEILHEVNLSASPIQGGTMSGAGNYSHNHTLKLTASPNPGFSLTGWSENGQKISYNDTLFIQITSDRNITAHFEPIIVAINAEVDPIGFAFIEGSGEYQTTEWVEILATPINSRYRFSAWTEKGEIVSEQNPYLFQATEDRNIVATFILKTNEFKVELFLRHPDAGELTGQGIYNEGDSVVVGFLAGSNYEFIGWKNDQGQIISRHNPFKFEVFSDTQLEAVLAKGKSRQILSHDQIIAFPNPGNGRFTLHIPLVVENMRLEIRDSAGHLVLKQQISTQSHDVNISHMAPGLYIINLHTNDTVNIAKVIIK